MAQNDLLDRLTGLLAAAGVHTSVTRDAVRVAIIGRGCRSGRKGSSCGSPFSAISISPTPPSMRRRSQKSFNLYKGLRLTWCCCSGTSRRGRASASPGQRQPGLTSWPSSNQCPSAFTPSSVITIIPPFGRCAPGDVASARAQGPRGRRIPVLVNRATRLSWRGQGVWLAGLGDQLAVHEDGGVSRQSSRAAAPSVGRGADPAAGP